MKLATEEKDHTCCICSEVVSIRAMGAQHRGRVSISVGRLCVNSGFMYLVSKPLQARASHAFSDEGVVATAASARTLPSAIDVGESRASADACAC